jgi:RimJ/RimL family protein N-acetyltransferase
MIGNGAGICALGVDALARQGFGVLPGSPERRSQLPAYRDAGGALDLGHLQEEAIVSAVQTLLADPTLPALLLIHSPAGEVSHEQLATRLLERPDPRLLTVWLGLDTALAARSLCTEAGLATFTSADAAARALRYRWEHYRNRELLTQTPPPQHPGTEDSEVWRVMMAKQRAKGVSQLPPALLQGLLRAYGLGSPDGTRDDGQGLCVQLREHLELGLHLQLVRRGTPLATGFAPLDALLAGRLIDQAGIAESPKARAEMVLHLLALSQLAIDQPWLARLYWPVSLTSEGATGLPGAELHLRQQLLPDRQRLVLAPYPLQLSGQLACTRGERFHYRPVRPSDEPALIALLQRLDPEEVRLRFFVALRHFSHAMGARMSQIDYDRELSLVLTGAGDENAVAAIATLVADPDNTEAEFALLVHHDHAGRGLGRQLLQLLIEEAWRRGIGRVYGVVLAENTAMLTAAARLGFRRRPEPDDPGCVRVEILAPAD